LPLFPQCQAQVRKRSDSESQYFIIESSLSSPETVPRLRAPKTTGVSSDDNILAGFMPVPAVPQVSRPRQTPPSPPLVTTLRPSQPSRGNNVEENIVSQQTTSKASDPSLQRKAFKRCHGKCVQKFCLPIDDLGIYDTCSSKCKGICEQ